MARQIAKKTTTTTTETMRTPTTFKGVTKARTKIMPSEEQIRARAFEIFQRRNGGPGDAHADWLQAERELTEEYSR
jgi:hypothetical protein